MSDTKTLLLIALVWALGAYLIVPRMWAFYFRRHPPLTKVARVTETGDGHPGDPVNIGLAGDEAELVRGMTAAGWFPANPITVESSVQHRRRHRAPPPRRRCAGEQSISVRPQAGLCLRAAHPGGPGKRHHVRFWRWDQLYEGRPAWFGAATFDRSVGLSHTTGQVTHHIAPDIDAERDRLVAELREAGVARSVEWKDGFHAEREGKNGGGDPWHTDGRLAIVTLR